MSILGLGLWDILRRGEAIANDLPSLSTLFAGKTGLENAKSLVTGYKTGKIEHMTPELWQAKKVVDSTLHPGTEHNLNCGA